MLALERTADGGVGEFEPVRDDLARDAVARGGDDATATVPAEQLARVEQLARQGNAASDARLLGWYYLVRDNHAEAETWFRMAREREDSAEASQGLALALMARGQHEEAEAITYRWRDESDEIRAVYLAAAANLLGTDPRPTLSEDVLGRIVAEVVAARDVPGARQLGWYARAWEQHQTAGQWFSTALRWDPDDEPSAYGLALTRHLLGDTAGLAEIKRIWAGRSDRIRDVGDRRVEPAPTAPTLPRAPTATPRRSESGSQPSEAAAAPQAAAQPRTAAPPRRSCTSHADPRHLSAEAALQRGWCLMDANRPMEAVDAFAVALGGARKRRAAMPPGDRALPICGWNWSTKQRLRPRRSHRMRAAPTSCKDPSSPSAPPAHSNAAAMSRRCWRWTSAPASHLSASTSWCCAATPTSIYDGSMTRNASSKLWPRPARAKA
ncbi:tetratricopeptide repeat protein [Neoaquamicrobium sediminum]|uniref:tetratricopeptide repeat protein n=1 Tax=Neoaquamicrobium sediminum TaxID=1849104 RepID=UPI001FD4899D|nr:tetratricopeptide repeat protein [Mesorhizobium sediminum]